MQDSLEYIKQAFELKSQNCYKQAIEMLYKALELENDNTEILFQLGELYFLLKNFQRAEHYLEKVLAKDENHIETLKILEQIYVYSNNISKAFMLAEKVYKLEQNRQNLLKLIDILSKKADIKKLKEFENSDCDEVLYALAKAYYDNKLIQDSERVLNKVLDINSDNVDAKVLLGKIYFDKSEFDKSKEIFSSFSTTYDNPEILNYLGLFALEDMKFVDAIKYFSKASCLNKKNSKYFYNLANAYFYNGWIKEALASYMQAIYIEPENLGYRYSLAYLYYTIQKFDKAQNEVDYMLELNSDYPQAHVLSALLKFHNHDFLGAELELETNLKNGNDDNFTLISLADVYAELKKFEKAEKLVKKVIENNPNSLNYKCKLADIYTAEKNYENALTVVKEIIETDENYIKAYITGAKSAFEMKDFDKTKEFAQTAISLDMNYAGGYYYLALVRLEEKDFDEAVECMKRAITYDIENPEYYAFMSKIYEQKQDFSSALEYMQEAESISQDTEYRIQCKRLAALKKHPSKI